MRKRLLLLFFCAVTATTSIFSQTATDGDYRSVASGNWSSIAIWQIRAAGAWSAATVVPSTTNNVYIQPGFTVTVDVTNVNCNDLQLNTAGFLVIGDNAVNVNGKLRAYTGTAVTGLIDDVFYSSQANAGALNNTMATSSSIGVLKIVGATRTVITTSEWLASGLQTCNIEFALNVGATATIIPSFKFRNVVFSSGTVSCGSSARVCADDANGTGSVTIKNGATLISARSGTTSQVISANSTAKCGTVTIETGATLNLTGSTPAIDCSTFSNAGTVIYSGTSQTLLQKGADAASVALDSYFDLRLQTSGTKQIPGYAVTINNAMYVEGAAAVSNSSNTTLKFIMANNSTIYKSSSASTPILSTAIAFGTTSTDRINITINITSAISGEFPSSIAPGAIGTLTIGGGITYTANSTRIINDLVNNGILALVPSTTMTLTVLNSLGGSGTITSNSTSTNAVTLIVGNSTSTAGNAGTLKLTPSSNTLFKLTFSKTGPSTLTLGSDVNLNSDLTIAAGNTLNDNGNVITVGGNISGSSTGTHISTGNGKIVLTAPSSAVVQTSNLGTAGNIEFNDADGFSLGSSMIVTGTLTATAGTIDLNTRNITLRSTAAGTARFAATTVATPFNYSSTGRFICEKYFAGGGSAFPVSGNSNRGYRFLSHPLNAAIPLSQIIGASEISITGSGAGFSSSTSGNPSAFAYDPTATNAGTVSGITTGGSGLSDPGWTAIADATTNIWGVGQGLRIFYRGSSTQGLTSSADYTVGNATITVQGQINLGGVSGLQIPLTYSTTGYNLLGNPFPSPVNLKNVTRTSNVSNFVYVFKANQGARGGYGTVDVTSDYMLPAFAGFFALATNNSITPTITFKESDKVATETSDVLFRTANTTNAIKFKIEDANTFWDELEIRIKADESANKTANDALKFFNSDVNFYSIAADGKYLSIDSRAQNKNEAIPLGFTTAQARTFTLTTTSYNVQQGVELYLIDKYLNTETKIEAGMKYTFATTANAASQGNSRFEIFSKSIPSLITINPTFSIKLFPNPATDKVQINFSNEQKANTRIKMINANGQVIKNIDAGNVQNGLLNIDVNKFAKGIYYIQVDNGINVLTEKLSIQ